MFDQVNGLLDDPDWHPSEQERAEALAACEREPQPRQPELPLSKDRTQ